MQEKPQIGLVLMRSTGPHCAEPGEFLEAIRADERIILNQLEEQFEIAGKWIVDSPEAVPACQAGLNATAMDMVLLAYQTWAEDSVLSDLLPALGACPLVVWCYLPWRRLPRPTSLGDLERTSGLVGAFAALGVLRNLGKSFLFTFGAPDDPRLRGDLRVAGRAAHLRTTLRAARFGLVPSQSGAMQATLVDLSRLQDELGPRVELITADAYRLAAQQVSETQVSAYVEEVRRRFPVEEVPAPVLSLASRAALGLARLAGEYHLDLVAVNDQAPELYRALGIRPAFYPDLSGSGSVLYQPEADLGAATANYILQHLTGSPTLFLELYFWDEAKNEIVGGHGGLQNPALADPREVRVAPDDYSCLPEDRVGAAEQAGAQFQFVAHPGRVTLFQLRSTPRGWQAVALSAMCLEGQTWLEGHPHAILRLDAIVEHFLNRAAAVGVTPHWVMAYGNVLHELEAFCQMADIPLETLSY